MAGVRDRELSKIVANIQSESEEKSGCSVVEGILHYKGILVLPKPSQFIEMSSRNIITLELVVTRDFSKLTNELHEKYIGRGLKKM